MYGIPVGEKQFESEIDADLTYKLLTVFEKFKYFRNVTNYGKQVTIWENLDVAIKSRK